MNNLQFLYQLNSDFRSLIDNHLVVFEHWYRTELGDTHIESDIEANEWLMAAAPGSDSESSAHYDAEKIRELLIATYQLAYSMYDRVPLKDKTIEETQRMTDIFQAAYDLGIEIEI